MRKKKLRFNLLAERTDGKENNEMQNYHWKDVAAWIRHPETREEVEEGKIRRIVIELSEMSS